MESNEEINSQILNLRSNADNLSNCLGSLLKRIEELERSRLITSSENQLKSENLYDNPLEDETVNEIETFFNSLNNNESELRQHKFTNIDPITDLKKQTVVTERISSNTKTYHTVQPSNLQIETNMDNNNIVSKQSPSSSRINDDEKESHLLASAYESRIIKTTADSLTKIDVEFRCGEAVVIKAGPEISKVIHPGDTILEINGEPLTSKKQLYSFNPTAGITLKLVLSDIYSAPMEFCKILEDYNCDNKTNSIGEKNLPYLSFNLKKGDVLQILSVDKTYMQARKVNDLSTAGYVPSNIKIERVAMLSPYGRKCIVLLGAKGVGRRTIKEMLLDALPNVLATVVPITSRAPRAGEQEGREYNFFTKENILKKIRAGEMIEWGEFGGQLYGTSADSVRRVVRSGRVCVLDCEPKSLKYLYNREFMPYVVVITPPSLNEFAQLNELRSLSGEKIPKIDYSTASVICEKSDVLLRSDYAKFFHLILVNRNRELTLKRLLEALEHLKNESQWIPASWLD